MATTKKTNTFIIIFSSIFIASFFMLQAVFDRIEWSSWVELILTVAASGLASALLAPYFNDEKKRKHGIVLSGIYALMLVGVLLFLERKHKDAIQLTDVWTTKESDGENFSMDFFRKDSVLLVFPPSHERVVGYVWEKNRLRLYDEERNLLFDWTIKLESDKFILRQGEDELIFYKQ
jgi:general stress protein CsbA